MLPSPSAVPAAGLLGPSLPQHAFRDVRQRDCCCCSVSAWSLLLPATALACMVPVGSRLDPLVVGAGLGLVTSSPWQWLWPFCLVESCNGGQQTSCFAYAAGPLLLVGVAFFA
jgi:hypothetical protein